MQERIAALSHALFQGAAPEGHVEAAMERIGALGPADLKRALEFVSRNEAENEFGQLKFIVRGDPPVSKRPRSARIKNKQTGAVVGVRVFAADAEDQESLRDSFCRQLPSGHIPYAGEVEILLEIYRPMLASWSPYKRLLAELGYIRAESKPDFDNFAKIIVDAMRGIVFVDDGQIVNATVSIAYSAVPRLEVTLNGRKQRMNK